MRAALLILLIAAAGIILRAVRGPSDELRMARMVQEAGELRAAADSCVHALARARDEFDAYASRIDSLRAAVDRFESARRTVPAELYEQYLAAFHAYNAAAGEWAERAGALRADWAACRAVAEAHNELADSAAALHERTLEQRN